MNFEVDRYSSAWAHIALCADLTWASEPPDDFIIANQRLWAQHCRVSQVLQDSAVELQCLPSSHNSCENNDKQLQIARQSQENGSYSGRRSVKDVIPESRLAQYYGNFYYDELRERCYTSPNEKTSGRGYNGQGCENSDLTECWMLPEVEYWFRKLLDEPSDRGIVQRRRRQFKIAPDEDLCVPFLLITSERWVSSGACAGEEAALAARVHAVKALWSSQSTPQQSRRTLSPPSQSRKIRARRRQPRRLAALAPPPPAYCLNVPAQLFCDPSCKFQFDTPRQPQLNECQRAMSRLSASVQAVMRASASRCPPYRGTNVSRYAPTSQRPARGPEKRYGVWWPRDHPSPKLDKFRQTIINTNQTQPAPKPPAIVAEPETISPEPPEQQEAPSEPETETTDPQQPEQKAEEDPDTCRTQKEQVVSDGQQPCTSAAATAADSGLRKKRLYSTVLSMSAPAPLNLTQVGCVRLSQKLVTPGILKLNPKIVLPAARIRPPNVENKFEELEKEALEQYKASDESIDTKFRELEKQAVEQYSTSNSNTSCSSGNSAEKQTSNCPTANETDASKQQKQPAKFHKEKAVDSVVIYSQNFPDLNQQKTHTNSEMNLKNFHTPPRGEKKEQNHRTSKSRGLKCESQRAASDTDYEAREASGKGSHKVPMRWTLHVTPKKRHLTSCASDCSSDEELHATCAIKDAAPCLKTHAAGKVKLSAHGAGDLHPIMRKT